MRGLGLIGFPRERSLQEKGEEVCFQLPTGVCGDDSTRVFQSRMHAGPSRIINAC